MVSLTIKSMAINMKNEDDLGTEKVYQPTKLRNNDKKKSRLNKALRDNLKKRKLQSRTRKITNIITDSSDLIKE